LRQQLATGFIPLASILLFGAAAPGHEGWRTFASPAGFSVSYPTSWSVLKADPDALDALSPGHREEGIIVGPHQGELRVEQLPLGQNVDTATRDWVKDERATKASDAATAPTNCRGSMVEDAEGEGPPERTFALFCSVNARTFRVSVRYWADDPAWRTHQAVAVYAASSIRIKGS
jgi:hypothetical protein